MSELLLDAEQGASYSDNTVSATQDPFTGLYYPLKGLGTDWYVEWAKSVFSVTRAILGGSFRVYRDSTDGALQFSIIGGKFYYKGVLVTLSNAINQTLTAANTNLISILTTGTLNINTTWPVTDHLKIAQIITDASTWDMVNDLTDLRTEQLFRVSGSVPAADLTDRAKFQVTVVPDISGTSPQTITILVNDLAGDPATVSEYLIVSIHNDVDGGDVTKTDAVITVGAKGTLIRSLSTVRDLYCKTNTSGQLDITITKPTVGVCYVATRAGRRAKFTNHNDIGTVTIS